MTLGCLIFLSGLIGVFYPTFSDLWNQYRQSKLISNYVEVTKQMSEEDYSAWWNAAKEYNENLDPAFRDAFKGQDPDPQDPYWSMLNVNGDGIMGYIEIPKISVRLPIYHGTGDDALQHGVGHLAGTSLPVGGSGTHAVLSGHRGLPSALLFTDLDQLEEGDLFILYILGEKLVYSVDQIDVVLPDEVSSLQAQDGHDYVTLITCTPYGVNTHRLLVRGERTEVPEEEIPTVTVTEQVVQSFGWKGKLAAAIIGVIVAILLIAAMRKCFKNRRG